jgi:hypothetical protein
MGISPVGHRLYSKSTWSRQVPVARIRRLVCFTSVLFALLSAGIAQVARKRTISKGPRAVALLQIATDGRARLIPVTIMVNGDFYDGATR